MMFIYIVCLQGMFEGSKAPAIFVKLLEGMISWSAVAATKVRGRHTRDNGRKHVNSSSCTTESSDEDMNSCGLVLLIEPRLCIRG